MNQDGIPSDLTLATVSTPRNDFRYTNFVCRDHVGKQTVLRQIDRRKPKANVHPMKDQVLASQIANQLRRNILLGKLQPGSSIKERDNAAELGVSRTPLREAIRILATEGLVELRTARSPIVSVPTIQQISDDVEVLLSIEQLSAELACIRATDDDIRNLRQLVTEMDRDFDTADRLDMFEIDMSFHKAIAEASHNASLAGVHSTFLARLWRARYLAAMQRRNRVRVIDHHTEIVTAFENRDAPRVKEAIQMHLGNLRKDIVRLIEQERDTQATPASE